MRSFIIILLVLGVYLAYKKHNGFGSLVEAVASSPSRGARSTFARGNGQATNFSTTGSATPGSGIPPTQPGLSSTYGIGGEYGIGYTGISYQQRKGQS